ncbi:MAG: TetR/AcrR family transcriptional regulator [Acidimicrobiia bacterium]|nr:TetR/AcrR family transcriptional regulator [Acidimicrobiia bacterium]
MGRTKTYNRDDLIDRAMGMFRRHGYVGTSTQMLVEGLNVNRYSIYAEFGDKQTLFDAALERYEQTVIRPRFDALEQPESGLADIRALFEFYAAAADGPVSGQGCLLCNTAVELGPSDPSGAGFVARYFQRLSRGFEVALGNSCERGELDPSVDVEAQAHGLTAAVLGMFVMLRAAAPAAMVANAAAAAIDQLESLGRP